MARLAHNPHPPARSQSAHRPRRHDRSLPGPSPASSVPFDIRPEHPLAPIEPDLFVQLSGRNNRNASMTGTSPRASVSETRVWQFAVLPNAEAYCGATPTEYVPFLGSAVSSITSTASLPPTSLSACTRNSVSRGLASQPPAAMK